jgi:site-specific recombinase XerD
VIGGRDRSPAHGRVVVDNAGRSLKAVPDLLSHKTLTMTLHYAHLAPERLRENVAALDN